MATNQGRTNTTGEGLNAAAAGSGATNEPGKQAAEAPPASGANPITGHAEMIAILAGDTQSPKGWVQYVNRNQITCH